MSAPGGGPVVSPQCFAAHPLLAEKMVSMATPIRGNQIPCALFMMRFLPDEEVGTEDRRGQMPWEASALWDQRTGTE
jgi:hypothetical protein